MKHSLAVLLAGTILSGCHRAASQTDAFHPNPANSFYRVEAQALAYHANHVLRTEIAVANMRSSIDDAPMLGFIRTITSVGDTKIRDSLKIVDACAYKSTGRDYFPDDKAKPAGASRIIVSALDEDLASVSAGKISGEKSFYNAQQICSRIVRDALKFGGKARLPEVYGQIDGPGLWGSWTNRDSARVSPITLASIRKN